MGPSSSDSGLIFKILHQVPLNRKSDIQDTESVVYFWSKYVITCQRSSQTMQLPFVFVPEKENAIPLSEATLPLNDRSFLFGDSVYEVISTRNQKPYFVQDHIDRLYASAQGIYMDMPWHKDHFSKRIIQGLAQLEPGYADEIYIRIIVSRGTSDFNIDTRDPGTAPRAYFLFKKAPQYLGRFVEEGFYLRVSKTRRNPPQSLSPALKTGNYLNNVLCLHEARSEGADDALILDIHGHVTEASTSNFGIVKHGVIVTAPHDVGILQGITRHHLTLVAQNLGIAMEIRPFTLDEVWEAQEAFVSSSLKGAMPVYRINDHFYDKGYGPVTQKLNTAYWAYVDQTLEDNV